MKKYIYIAVALLVATFASCQSEDAEISSTYKNDANAVHFSASIDAPQTRVNTMGNGDTWENGDVIKVCNVSDNAIENKDEAVYQYKNNTWELIGSNYIVWADGNENGENTFKAFYPSDDNMPFLYASSGSPLCFDLPCNQSSNNSTDDNYIGKADLMMATAKVAKTTEPVNLQFRHLLSKVTVNIIKYNNQYEDTKPSFDKSTFYIKRGNHNYGEYRVYGSESNIHPIIASNENGLQKFTAILLPYKYQNDELFLKLKTSDGISLPVYASGILTTDGLEAGKAYNFDLVVGKNVVSIEKVTVTPWIKNDWDNQEGIADEAYTFKVDADDNSKFTLTSLKTGFTSNIDEKTKQNIEKCSTIYLQGPVNVEDVRNIIKWLCGNDPTRPDRKLLDMSNAMIDGRSLSAIFPEDGVAKMEVVLPDVAPISSYILYGSNGRITIDITKCSTPIMSGEEIDLDGASPVWRFQDITIKATSAQREYIEQEYNGWSHPINKSYGTYLIQYVD